MSNDFPDLAEFMAPEEMDAWLDQLLFDSVFNDSAYNDPAFNPLDANLDFLFQTPQLENEPFFGSVNSFPEASASHGPESGMEVVSAPAETPASVNHPNGSQQLNDHSAVGGSSSTTLTPAAQDLRVTTPGSQATKPERQTAAPTPQPNLQPRPGSLPVAQRARSEMDECPKRYHTHSQPTATTRPQMWLASQMNTANTFEYQSYFNSSATASYWRRHYESLSTAPKEATVTNPRTDMTFPQNQEQWRDCHRQLFEAICDFSSPREWRNKMGQKRAEKWMEEVMLQRSRHGLETDKATICDDEIAPPPERMPSLEVQWKNVVHSRTSDIEIELLCAQILDQAILAQQGKNFIPLWSNNETQWEEFATFGER
ncbi:hypothetical protein F66182_6387 [Fusarium sp. NRRL 66182]|nr:hypothetical protein F66182_6387 [Fusarium sp. NRRL 66182]